MTIAVPRETEERLAYLEALVLAENKLQNLVSASTVDHFRVRHIEDSLQLLPYIRPGTLIDIGSGAGFPGLVLACCREDTVHLVEPRARRAEFLAGAAASLGLRNVVIHQRSIERLTVAPAATITARAVAPLSALFMMAVHLSDAETQWVLPKGRAAARELDTAGGTWQGEFDLIPSKTDPDARIVLAKAVRRRQSR